MTKKIKDIKDDGIVDAPKLKLKRTYPEKACANTANCISGGKFAPTDRRQVFCCAKCGEIFRNDKRHLANNTDFKNEKLLRRFDKKLERLFYFFVDGSSRANVWVEFFRYEGIDLRLLVSENTNESTKQQVRWFYRFGTERNTENPEFFIIYQRKIKTNE
jgi:hypothetical protein